MCGHVVNHEIVHFSGSRSVRLVHLFIFPPFNEFIRQQRIKYLENTHPSFVFIHVRGVCTCKWIKQPFQNEHEVQLFYNSHRPDEITVY